MRVDGSAGRQAQGPRERERPERGVAECGAEGRPTEGGPLPAGTAHLAVGQQADVFGVPPDHRGVQREGDRQLAHSHDDCRFPPAEGFDQQAGERDVDRRGQPSDQREQRQRGPAAALEPVGDDHEADRVEGERHREAQAAGPENGELPELVDLRQEDQAESAQRRPTRHQRPRPIPIDEAPDRDPGQADRDEAQ